MNDSELLNVLLHTNQNMENPLEENLIESILSCVILNPLPEDRGVCQGQITLVINQYTEKLYDNN